MEVTPWDPVSYYRARYYDPQIGRFTGEDPLGLATAGSNLYEYAYADPVDLTDPLGLKPGDKYTSLDCAGWNSTSDMVLLVNQTAWEWTSVIYQNPDGTYSYTVPVTQQSHDTGTPLNQIPIPRGTAPAGWSHAHPLYPGLLPEPFSPSDKWISEHLNYSELHPTMGPGYLLTPTRIRKYTPLPGKPNKGNVTTMTKPCGCS